MYLYCSTSGCALAGAVWDRANRLCRKGFKALKQFHGPAFTRLVVLFSFSFAFPACSGLALAQSLPANFDDIAGQATVAREQNKIADALVLYQHAVQLKPEWAEGWWFQGMLQYGGGEYASARDALSHYIELMPKAGPAMAVRGLCEFEMGDYTKSLEDIQHGLELGAADGSRDEAIVLYHEALLLTTRSAFEDALKIYASLAKLGGPVPEMLMGIGLAGLRIPLLPKDVNAATRSLLLAGGSAGFAYSTGDYARAEQEFRNLFEKFPKAPNAHYFYGYLLFATDPDRAVVEFQRELQIDAANDPSQAMLAWFFLLRDEPAEALPYAEKAASEAPASPTSQLVLGRSLVETANVASGLEHLKTALNLEPESLEVHLALAEAYSKLGRKDDARRERILSLELAKG